MTKTSNLHPATDFPMHAHPSVFERFAHGATIWAGKSWAFALAVLVIVVWLISGPFFDFSDTWQLIVNTSTTIITFLMVFLIQRSQNKEGQAVQIKLNEIIAAMKGASNRLINVEDLSEDDVRVLHEHFERLTRLAQLEKKQGDSISVDKMSELEDQLQTHVREGHPAPK